MSGPAVTTFLAAVAASKATYVLSLHESSTDPDVDVPAIAAGLGARTERIADRGAVGGVLARALAHPGPSRLVLDREP